MGGGREVHHRRTQLTPFQFRTQPTPSPGWVHPPIRGYAMKQCSKCGTVKPIGEFYSHKWHGGGLRAWCKTCMAEYYGAYRKTSKGKDAFRRAYTKCRAIRPIVISARKAVSNAIRDGRIVRPTVCSECRRLCKPHAHHEDYSSPLEVQWLCRPCHDRLHLKVAL